MAREKKYPVWLSKFEAIADAQHLTLVITYTFRIIKAIEHILLWCTPSIHHHRTHTNTYMSKQFAVPISSFLPHTKRLFNWKLSVFTKSFHTRKPTWSKVRASDTNECILFWQPFRPSIVGHFNDMFGTFYVVVVQFC